LNDASSEPSVQEGGAPQRASLAPSDGERWILSKLFQVPPPVACRGARMTPQRIHNLIQSNVDEWRGAVTVSSRPIKLTIEATNICNLRCPACFTGTEQIGRERGHLSLELFRRLLDELGPYLFEIEFYNWGEPLLGKNIYELIADAHHAGVSTTVSTNFSIPFDDASAERIVRSGLTVLGVSIDGAQQHTYEQYRVRGDLALVLENCRRVAAAKARLGSETPALIWEFHVFPHNIDDIDAAKRMAAEIGMQIAIDKGWLIGPDWDTEQRFEHGFRMSPIPARCSFLWHQAVVNTDGGVAPCCGTFYREDDVGRLTTRLGDGGAATFMDVWNGELERQGRSFFLSRDVPEQQHGHVCRDCPYTLRWESWVDFLRSGAPPGTFVDSHELGINYFWKRVPPGTPEDRGVVRLRRKPSGTS
jgi:MoaA/NifB/PqqE/SkfB family radical SAM enzyme